MGKSGSVYLVHQDCDMLCTGLNTDYNNSAGIGGHLSDGKNCTTTWCWKEVRASSLGTHTERSKIFNPGADLTNVDQVAIRWRATDMRDSGGSRWNAAYIGICDNGLTLRYDNRNHALMFHYAQRTGDSSWGPGTTVFDTWALNGVYKIGWGAGCTGSSFSAGRARVNIYEVRLDYSEPGTTITAPSTASFQNDMPVTFSGDGTLGGKAPYTYEWRCSDWPEVETGQTIHKNFSWPGTYEVELTVYDSIGGWATNTHTITMEDSVPPTAVITPTQLTINKGSTAVLNGTQSYDEIEVGTLLYDGIKTYTWTIYDDHATETREGPIVYYAFNEEGEFIVTLTVENFGGLLDTTTDDDRLTVTVEPLTSVDVKGIGIDPPV